MADGNRSPAASSAPAEKIVTRFLDAPRALVYQAWTDPKHVVHWWQPGGFAPPVIEKMDVRVGGEWRIRMHHESGIVYTAHGVYRELQAPVRIVYDDFCDENGVCFHQTLVTVTFDEEEGGTRVTIRSDWSWIADRDPKWTPDIMQAGWAQGWNDNLDRLEGRLSEDRAITITRLVSAPRELVWRAWTEREHLDAWWGPNGFRNTTLAFDLRPGGIWRFIMHGPDGTDYPNRIVYAEVQKPSRLVYLHSDDVEVGGEHFRTTVTLADRGGRTEITMRVVFPSREARDLTVERVGAIEGGNQTMDRLAGHVVTMT